jgi:hypothetical protein
LAHCASVSSRVVRAMGANFAHLSHQHCKHALGGWCLSPSVSARGVILDWGESHRCDPESGSGR